MRMSDRFFNTTRFLKVPVLAFICPRFFTIKIALSKSACPRFFTFIFGNRDWRVLNPAEAHGIGLVHRYLVRKSGHAFPFDDDIQSQRSSSQGLEQAQLI